MDSQTILRANSHQDLKSLPLGAREAFVLSQLDGRLTLEEIAEIAGFGVSETTKVGQTLLDLGAASRVRIDMRAETRSMPRVESFKKSIRPQPSTPVSSGRKSLVREDPRAEKVSLRPPKHATPPPPPPRMPTPRPERKPSRKSIQKMTAVSEPCELDEGTLASLALLEARVTTARDHYAVLDIERATDKKGVKRAYFAFASKFHPDRFFGKKLGKARSQIDRIFQRMTEAHDTLTDNAARTAYDARLPPLPKQKTIAPPKQKTIAPPKQKTIAPPGKTKTIAPPKQKTIAPPGSPRKTIAPNRPTRKLSKAAMQRVRSTTKLPAQTPPPKIDIGEKRQNLRDAAVEIRTQERIDMFVKAAEEALEKNDIVSAANNYRLALEHREDRRLRMIFEDVEDRAKKERFKKVMSTAKAAEGDHRWADAAALLAKAHGIVPTADVASRAAHAHLLAKGDLTEAARLGEAAVTLEPKVLTHRLTVAEVYLAAGKMDRAEEHADIAHDLAPKDDRVKALFGEIAKKSKR